MHAPHGVTGALLGNWEVERGHPMHCHHETKELLVWEVLVSLPWQKSYKYKYAVVQTEEGKGGVKVRAPAHCSLLAASLHPQPACTPLEYWTGDPLSAATAPTPVLPPSRHAD